MAADTFYEGKRLSYDGELCTVRWTGEVPNTKGRWLGVEWDDTWRGKHAGEHKGVRYFRCASSNSTAASFIRPNRPSDRPVSFIEAVHNKYASEVERNVRDAAGDASSEGHLIRISGKKVKEVGFEKIRMQLANLKELRVVLVDTLCVSRPSARTSDVSDIEEASNLSEDDVAGTCPKTTELDLSRNLFEDWGEVLDICRQLRRLRSLRVDGNRFKNLSTRHFSRCLSQTPFTFITSLSLDHTLLSWKDVVGLASVLPSLTSLSASGNEYKHLDDTSPLTSKLEKLILEDNKFTCLSDIEPLTKLQNLQRIGLKENSIGSIKRDSSRSQALMFPSTLQDIDLSSNSISNFHFFDELVPTIPGLSSIRVSNNLLYVDLKSANGTALTLDDGYMLTLARLGRLERLNFSQVTPKDCLNAETYYLSQITQQLSLSPATLHASILATHARYTELCAKYGAPALPAQATSDVNPNSLAARLVAILFKLDATVSGPAGTTIREEFELRLPKTLSIYAVLGIVGKKTGLPPMQLELVWETGEAEVVREEDELSDFHSSDGEREGDTRSERDVGSRRDKPAARMREEVLMPRIRALGTWIEEGGATVRVRWSEVEVAKRNEVA